MAGRTWAAFAIRDVEDGTPRAGARPLGAVTLDHDLAIEDTLDDVPDWDELSPENVLVPHLLAVDPAARGGRVALALMAACAGEARRQGSTHVRLSTSTENVAANELYRRMGFQLGRPVHLPYPGPFSPWSNLYELDLASSAF
jgi:GNAT superfamily N-acetyltransferase